jgi:hypothetical protein
MGSLSRQAKRARNQARWAAGERWTAAAPSPAPARAARRAATQALKSDLAITGGRSAYDRADVGFVEFARVNGSGLARPCGCARALPVRREHFYRYGSVVICLMCGHIYLGEDVRAREYVRKLDAH